MHSYCILENHTKEVNCCSFSENFFVTCSGDKTVRIYYSNNLKELSYSPIKIFKYGVNFVSFSKSGKYLAAACSDGKAYLFELTSTDVKTYAILRHSDTSTVQVCSFSNNSYFMVTGSADGSIALWDIIKKKLIREISGHPEGNIYAAAFTPCDVYLVTGSGLGDLRVWDAGTLQSTMQTQAHDEGVSSCGVTCIEFSPTYHSSTTDPDRCYLMASCGQDNKIKIWVFSNQSKGLKLFHTLSGHHGPVSFCAFSPDGKNLASSSFDKTVIIWDPLTHEQLMVLDGHGTIVTSVAYSSNDCIASTSYDKKVIVWKTDVESEETDDVVSADSPQTENATTGLTDLTLDTEKAETSTKVNFESWSCDEVASWLTEQVKLGQYTSNFRENEIDGAELTALTTDMLRNDLGIAPLGHRNKIIRAISSLKEGSVVQVPTKSTSPVEATEVQGWRKVVKSQVKITDKRGAQLDGNIPDQFLCPISREIMKDPVIASDGHTYERSMIEGWLTKGNSISPMSNEVLPSKKLIPNQTLKSLILQFEQDQEKLNCEWSEPGTS